MREFRNLATDALSWVVGRRRGTVGRRRGTVGQPTWEARGE